MFTGHDVEFVEFLCAAAAAAAAAVGAARRKHIHWNASMPPVGSSTSMTPYMMLVAPEEGALAYRYDRYRYTVPSVVEVVSYFAALAAPVSMSAWSCGDGEKKMLSP